MSTTLLEQFFRDMEDLTRNTTLSDEELATTTGRLLEQIVDRPDVLPEQFTRRSDASGRRGRYILHRSPGFTVSSIVWAPGEVAEPHNHETWGAIGLVSNRIEERRYELQPSDLIRPVDHHELAHGAVSLLIPDEDIHSMHNLTKTDTVEIHVYGKDLTGLQRKKWTLEGDQMTQFESGKYANC